MKEVKVPEEKKIPPGMEEFYTPEALCTLEKFEEWDAAQNHVRQGGGADNLRARIEKNRLAKK